MVRAGSAEHKPSEPSDVPRVTMWSQLSADVQEWDTKPENQNTYAAVLNIIELLQALCTLCAH